MVWISVVLFLLSPLLKFKSVGVFISGSSKVESVCQLVVLAPGENFPASLLELCLEEKSSNLWEKTNHSARSCHNCPEKSFLAFCIRFFRNQNQWWFSLPTTLILLFPIKYPLQWEARDVEPLYSVNTLFPVRIENNRILQRPPNSCSDSPEQQNHIRACSVQQVTAHDPFHQFSEYKGNH